MVTRENLAAFQGKKTPFYAYNMGVLQQTLETCKSEADKYGYHVHYALKANFDSKVLQTISAMGFGADCVSGGEVKCAHEHGFAKEKIVFAGVGKSDEEIEEALDIDIACFNCESAEEVGIIQEIAAKKGVKARIALRINPNVSANTHAYITTGIDENKFGIHPTLLPDLVKQIHDFENIEVIGIHFHIGSQILDFSSFKNLCNRANEFNQFFIDHLIDLQWINVGGGLGIDYQSPEENPIPDFAGYFAVFNEFLQLRPNQQVHFELGRSLTGQFGSLITKVNYVKQAVKTRFAILDAGMTELMRPALYQAKHKVLNLSGEGREIMKFDIVGPVCESSDCFEKGAEVEELKRGDLVALLSAGAYGEVMASGYNLRTLQPSVYL